MKGYLAKCDGQVPRSCTGTIAPLRRRSKAPHADLKVIDLFAVADGAQKRLKATRQLVRGNAVPYRVPQSTQCLDRREHAWRGPDKRALDTSRLAPLAVDQYRCRQPEHCESELCTSRVCPQQRKMGDICGLEERRSSPEARRIDADREHADGLLVQGLRERVQTRHLVPARGAPRGPDIENNRRSDVIAKKPSLAVDITDRRRQHRAGRAE